MKRGSLYKSKNMKNRLTLLYVLQISLEFILQLNLKKWTK